MRLTYYILMKKDTVLQATPNGKANAHILARLLHFNRIVEGADGIDAARFTLNGGGHVLIPPSEISKLRGIALGRAGTPGLDPLTRAFNALEREGFYRHDVRLEKNGPAPAP